MDEPAEGLIERRINKAKMASKATEDVIPMETEPTTPVSVEIQAEHLSQLLRLNLQRIFAFDVILD
jgi:urease alpha subunit